MWARCASTLATTAPFYAFIEAEPFGLSLTPKHYNQLIDHGRCIKQGVIAHFPIKHPFEEELSFLYGTIFIGVVLEPGHHSRNVCIFAEGELDRSATGTGVSATSSTALRQR